jgi:selenocysteine lyase/cysteine desulfurase
MLDIVQTITAAPIPDHQAYQPSARDKAFAELEGSVYLALETYSNVHRGSGHKSMVTTRLYEQARDEVLDWLGLEKNQFTAIFCTPERASALKACLEPESCRSLSSQEIGLPLGIRALAVKKEALPRGVPFQTGGGTTMMVSRGSVIWEDAPDRFEAGTPAVINVIAFAKALQIIRRFGFNIFKIQEPAAATAFQILHQDEFKGFSGRKLLRKLRQTLIGRNIRVPTAEGLRPFTNMDNSASTPTFLPVWRAICQTWKLPERQLLWLITQVKEMCARFFNSPSDQYDLIFTLNTTEALNLVAKSLALERATDIEPVILNTLLEHNSNELPWRFAKGLSLVRMPVDEEGFIDLNELERVLRAYNQDQVHGKKRIRIAAMSGASNVLGTCNDIREISRLAHKYGAHLLVDAAQLAGHRKIKIEDDDIDYLAFSGHKMYAPFGSGALIARKGLLRIGQDEMEKIKASGEENVMGIAALGKSIGLLERIGMDVIQDEEQKLTRRALSKLATVPRLEVFGIKDPDSPRFQNKSGVICFSLKHVPHNLAAELLAEQGGIGVRSGCFCAHLLVKRLLRIHPWREGLANLGLKLWPAFAKSVLPGLVRVSFGLENDEQDIDHLIKTLKSIAAQPVSFMDKLLAWTHNATPFLPMTDVRRQMQAFLETVTMNVYELNEAYERNMPFSGVFLSQVALSNNRQPCCSQKIHWRLK